MSRAELRESAVDCITDVGPACLWCKANSRKKEGLWGYWTGSNGKLCGMCGCCNALEEFKSVSGPPTNARDYRLSHENYRKSKNSQ